MKDKQIDRIGVEMSPEMKSHFAIACTVKGLKMATVIRMMIGDFLTKYDTAQEKKRKKN